MSKTISVTIPDADAQLIERGLPIFNGNKMTTHGPLDLEKLVAMLLEDVALTVRRPTSWEGHNMCQVLSGHGYAT